MAGKQKGRVLEDAAPKKSSAVNRSIQTAGGQQDVPVVLATAKRVRDGRTRHVWLLKIICPYCGKRHTHGGGNGPEPRSGHRVSHCVPYSLGGYHIEIAEVDYGDFR